MSSFWDLFFHIKTLNVFGLVCCQYRRDCGTELTVTRWHQLQALGTFLLAELSAMLMLGYCILYPSEFHLQWYNPTGNQYIALHFGSSCLLMISLYWHFYLRRNRNIETLRRILRFYHNPNFPIQDTWPFRSCYGAYVTICLLCSLLYESIYRMAGLSVVPRIAYTLFFSITNFTAGIVILLHLSLKKIMELSLMHLNTKLDTMSMAVGSMDARDFQEILARRNQLLGICHEDLNHHYGAVYLLAVAFMLMTAPSGPYYLCLIVMATEIPEDTEYTIQSIIIIMTIWNLPWMATFIAMSAYGGLTKQADRTVLIVLRISRTKTNMDKTIDKFLWKSLRRKPILNAFGFFHLGSKTLFKCSASVVGFMMILMQFKQMENIKL